jgi:flagellar basal-body rod protein FlgB
MINGVEAVTTATLSLALDAAALRHESIAANIANANSVDHIPIRMNFDAELSRAREELVSQSGSRPSALPVLDIEVATGAHDPLDRVRLDAEMATMSQNSLHYQALLRGLSRHMSILESAVADGKR